MYRHTGVKADGLLYRMGGDDVYFDITVVYGVGQLDRDHPQYLKEYLAQTPEPIQAALGRAVTAKGRHYEQANKRAWKRLHPEQDFVAHGGTDAGVELRVSDLVPRIRLNGDASQRHGEMAKASDPSGELAQVREHGEPYLCKLLR